jgi:hypothetical protein
VRARSPEEETDSKALFARQVLHLTKQPSKINSRRQTFTFEANIRLDYNQYTHQQMRLKNRILKVIHVFSLINNSHKKANKCANVKVTFLHTIFHNSDTLRSILITFTEPLNINKIYTKT